MNGHSCSLYIEIGPTSLIALHGDEGLELPLERLPGGRLTDTSKEKLPVGLQQFLKRKNWQPRTRALCAIGARGVSLRRLTLPAAAREEFDRLLRMQIESEFPLSPDELAWGYRLLGETRQNGTTKQDLLVVAVRKEVIDEYTAIFSACGISPVFTVAALARSGLCPQPLGTFALLDFAGQHGELVAYENGIPTSIRILSWELESSTASPALATLAKSVPGNGAAKKLFLTGSETRLQELLPLIGPIGSPVECEPVKVAKVFGRSAATLGLKKMAESQSGSLLLFQSKQTNGRNHLTKPSLVKWAALATILVLGLLLLPYLEALLLKPWLERKYSAVKSDTGRLTTIDRELGFLQYLKQNQPPYLDALYLFSKSTPQGTRIDSLTMNRRGDVSLRSSMRNSDQVAEFRAKLIDSGFFSTVTVEEQTPTPDRQKVNVRITAQWKPAAALQQLAIGPTADEIEKAKNRKDGPGGGMPPGGMPIMPSGGMPVMPPGAMPVGLPPGVELPPGAVLKAAPPEKK